MWVVSYKNEREKSVTFSHHTIAWWQNEAAAEKKITKIVPNCSLHNHHHFHFLRHRIHFNMLHVATLSVAMQFSSIYSHQIVVNVQKWKNAHIHIATYTHTRHTHKPYDNRATGNRSIDIHLKKSWYFHKYLTLKFWIHVHSVLRTRSRHIDCRWSLFAATQYSNMLAFVRLPFASRYVWLFKLNQLRVNGVVLLLLVRLSRTHVRGEAVRSILLISLAPARSPSVPTMLQPLACSIPTMLVFQQNYDTFDI